MDARTSGRTTLRVDSVTRPVICLVGAAAGENVQSTTPCVVGPEGPSSSEVDESLRATERPACADTPRKPHTTSPSGDRGP